MSKASPGWLGSVPNSGGHESSIAAGHRWLEDDIVSQRLPSLLEDLDGHALNQTFPTNVRSRGLVIGARTIAHHVEGDESYAGEIPMSRGCQAHYTPP